MYPPICAAVSKSGAAAHFPAGALLGRDCTDRCCGRFAAGAGQVGMTACQVGGYNAEQWGMQASNGIVVDDCAALRLRDVSSQPPPGAAPAPNPLRALPVPSMTPR